MLAKKCDVLDLKKHVVKDRTTCTSIKKYIYKIVEMVFKNIDQVRSTWSKTGPRARVLKNVFTK